MPVVLVTGAAGGIGRATCQLFKAHGCTVIALDQKFKNAVPADHCVTFDLRTLGRHAAKLKKVLLPHLKGGLDVLVNNAAFQVVKPLTKLTPDDWRHTLDVNLLAPFWLTQLTLPWLKKRKSCVVNVASIHAQLSKPGFAAYATSKGALLSLTRAMALELAPEVRVNAVVPAAVDTPMLRAGFGKNAAAWRALGACHPVGRIAQPVEIARLIMFLASPENGFITGSAVNVDGGIGVLLHDPGV